MPSVNIYDYLNKNLYRIGAGAINESLSASRVSAGELASTLKEIAPENISSGTTVSQISLSNPSITDFSNANHSHLSVAQGGFLSTIALNSGTLGVVRGGTGASTLTGLLQGNGTSSFTAITNSTTVGQVLRVTSSNTYGWGALDLTDTDAVTGILPSANVAAGGATTQILFNNAGVISGDADLTFVTDTLTVAKLEVSSFTIGSVLFATTNGRVTQDNANFFWADSTNRLGILTATPSFPLDVRGSVSFGTDSAGTAAGGLLRTNAGTMIIEQPNIQSMQFTTNSAEFIWNQGASERMRIDTTGRLGIGVTIITAFLHLLAGTTTASTAPLKFTSGTNLATPEAGAVEWDGTNLFITQTDGTRKTIAYV